MAARLKAKAINYYQMLGVHPAAPLDLITAAYWHYVAEVQKARGSDPDAERVLYCLTKAYQTLADARSREQYDRALGLRLQPHVPGLFRRRRGLARLLPLRRGSRLLLGMPDHYEVLRVDPSAGFPMIQKAYELMRDYYLRLVKAGHYPQELLDALEDAYSVASNPELRAKYDARVRAARPDGRRAPVEKKPAAGKKKVAPAEAEPAKKQGIAAKAKKLGRFEKAMPEPAPKPEPATGARMESAPRARKAEGPSLLPRLAFAIRTAARLTRSTVKAIPSAFILLAGLVVPLIVGAWRVLANVFPDGPESAPARLDKNSEQTFLARLAWANVQLEEPVGAGHQDGCGTGRLVLTDGSNSGMTYDFQGPSATIGGDVDCDIQLPGLPAQSARLLCRNRRFVIYSLSDEEPIRINGDPAEWAILESGASITIGEHTLRLETGD